MNSMINGINLVVKHYTLKIKNDSKKNKNKKQK